MEELYLSQEVSKLEHAATYFVCKVLLILAETDPAKVGVSGLRFDNTHQLNIGMLPTLLPGANAVTVEGDDLSPGTALKVEFAWMEGSETKTRVETATKLPHVFQIQVAEKDPLKVKCLHQTLSVVGR